MAKSRASAAARRRDLDKRLERNHKSRNTADHHNEPWTEGELEVLQRWGGHGEEELARIAEELGRTIQACRQRYYCGGERQPVRFKITRRWVTDFCCSCGRFTDICTDDRKCVDCD